MYHASRIGYDSANIQQGWDLGSKGQGYMYGRDGWQLWQYPGCVEIDTRVWLIQRRPHHRNPVMPLSEQMLSRGLAQPLVCVL